MKHSTKEALAIMIAAAICMAIPALMSLAYLQGVLPRW